MKHYYFFFLFICGMASGQVLTGNGSTSTITISCESCVGQSASINTIESLSGRVIQLAKSSINTSGLLSVQVPVAHSLFTFLSIERDSLRQGFHCRLYLEPNQNVNVVVSPHTISFGGELGAANQYLYESDKIGSRLVDRSNELMGEFKKLSAEEQKNFKDSFGSEFTPINEAIEKSNELSAAAKALIVHDNTVLVMQRRQAVLRADLLTVEAGSDPGASQFFENIPVNIAAIKANIDGYERLLRQKMNIYLYPSIYFSLKKEGYEVSEDSLVLLADAAIRRNERTAPIREYLLAQNINIKMKENGLSPSLVKIVDDFKNDFPASSYLSILEEQYDKEMGLEEGAMAKEFEANDINGKPFSLNDLKGKIVYVDIWATWCAPCLAEFKHSNNMKEYYKENEKVVFLYVSVDEDVKKWKDFVAKGKAPKGIHVSNKTNVHDRSIFNIYGVSGIPHYVLIDQEGKIKKNRAPRPSDKMTYDLMDSLLKRSN